ncbi:MAG TPA: isoprenylcysteine carboxylmethyltransferase family protein [bacterium]|nr:isoprenylcysteine carboxylmethyltransferase family protein [bacterium]
MKPSSEPDHPGVIALPPLLFLGFLAAGVVLNLLRPLAISASNGLRIAGGVLVLGGLSLAVWGRKTMTRTGTNVNPRQPATALVVTGPFRYMRNPLYVAMFVMYIGLALLINTAWMILLLAILFPLMHWGVVLREERYLDRKFGEAYSRYCAVTRRWI